MTQDIFVRNNVKVYGQGQKTLMLAHGFGCEQNVWRFISPAFEEEYRIVLFDYVGSGKSDLSAYDQERYCNLRGYAQDVLEICEALQLSDIIYVGHSVGGMTGLLASIEKPELFERLILICPSPCYINDPPLYTGGFERAQIEELLSLMEKNYEQWAKTLAPTAILNPQQADLVAEFETILRANDPDMARCFAQATFFSDYREELLHVTVPTLIIQSCEDLIAPPEVGIFVHQQLLHSELQVLEAVGHCPHMSHPEELTTVIKKYLASPLQFSL